MNSCSNSCGDHSRELQSQYAGYLASLSESHRSCRGWQAAAYCPTCCPGSGSIGAAARDWQPAYGTTTAPALLGGIAGTAIGGPVGGLVGSTVGRIGGMIGMAELFSHGARQATTKAAAAE